MAFRKGLPRARYFIFGNQTHPPPGAGKNPGNIRTGTSAAEGGSSQLEKCGSKGGRVSSCHEVRHALVAHLSWGGDVGLVVKRDWKGAKERKQPGVQGSEGIGARQRLKDTRGRWTTDSWPRLSRKG